MSTFGFVNQDTTIQYILSASQFGGAVRQASIPPQLYAALASYSNGNSATPNSPPLNITSVVGSNPSVSTTVQETLAASGVVSPGANLTGASLASAPTAATTYGTIPMLRYYYINKYTIPLSANGGPLKFSSTAFSNTGVYYVELFFYGTDAALTLTPSTARANFVIVQPLSANLVATCLECSILPYTVFTLQYDTQSPTFNIYLTPLTSSTFNVTCKMNIYTSTADSLTGLTLTAYAQPGALSSIVTPVVSAN